MTEFKVGDKVRRRWTDGPINLGEVVDIDHNPARVDSALRICVEFADGWKYWFSAQELELVLPETHKVRYYVPEHGGHKLVDGPDDFHDPTIKTTTATGPLTKVTLSTDPLAERANALAERFTKVADELVAKKYEPGSRDIPFADKRLTDEQKELAADLPFAIKDSGVRQEYASGMVRDTEKGKARFDLLNPLGVPYDAQFLTRCAVHMAQGAEKYTDRNWEQANGTEELARYRSSALRHLQQWIAGEQDEDHAAAVFFNLLAAETVEYRIRLGF